MNSSEAARVQKYLRKRFNNDRISVKHRGSDNQSADLVLGDETMGAVFRDEDDDAEASGEQSFHVQMVILSEDLDDA